MARIVGTNGNDVLIGTKHRDVIIGKGGKDVIIGKGGDDVIRGGDGRDTIKGNGGNDTIQGGDGGDTLIGGSGDDTIKGQSGRDNIRGNSGDDDLYGNKGADLLFGAKGADDLWGGTGPDVFKFNAGDGFYDNFDPATIFVAPPSDVNSFDDVVHDFKGIQQGGTDTFDITVPAPGAFQLASDSAGGGYYIVYGDGSVWTGAAFLPGITAVDAGDFI